MRTFLRCPTGVPTDIVLAKQADGEVLIEMRGLGFAIVSPASGRCHETGRGWVNEAGGPETIAVVSADELEQVHAICRSFNEIPPSPVREERAPDRSDRGRPGDLFNAAVSCNDVFAEATDWREVRSSVKGRNWKYSGAKSKGGSSATVYFDTEHACVFSSSVPNIEEPGHNKLDAFGLFARLFHDGSTEDAAAELRPRGYSEHTKRADVLGWLREADADDPVLVLHDFTTVRIRRVRWVHDGRIPLGALTLLAGRQGLGKSTVTADRTARITRGELPGEFFGTPKDVVIYATEDALDYTIKPRLVAAGADLRHVHHIEMIGHEYLEMPRHIDALAAACAEHKVAMIVLDPLLSRLSGKLDSHKDAEVRQALEPLAQFAEETHLAVLGLIHLNKSSTTDPLQAIMASTAFTAVPRSVLFVSRHPDNEGQQLLGLAKANLGRLDLPTEVYTFGEIVVGADPDDGEPIIASRVQWLGESDITIAQALEVQPGDRNAIEDACEWLRDYIDFNGGWVFAADALKAGAKAGHKDHTLRRARERIKAEVKKRGFPAVVFWRWSGIILPDHE